VDVEATDGLVKKMSNQLQQCRKQRIKLMQEKKNPETKQVSKKNRNTRTQSKAKSTKKKAGCPCRKKRRK
jgi:hypothetical protein